MRRVVLPALLVLLAPAFRGFGDEVRLAGGGKLVGDVTESETEVRVTFAGGSVTVPRERVASIVRGTAAPAPPQTTPTLPEDAAADRALRELHGPDGGLLRTAHYRIAHDPSVPDLRARAERLEACWRKFHEWGAALGLRPEASSRPLEVRIFATFESFCAALGRNESDMKGLSGIYDHRQGRVYLYDVEQSPEVRRARQEIADAESRLAAARAALADVARSIAEYEAGRSAARGSDARRERESIDARIAEARAAGRAAQDDADRYEQAVAAQRGKLEAHVERENFSSATHEAAHQISFATGVCRPDHPIWLIEGLATLFEVQGRLSFVPEAPNRARLTDLRAARAAGRRTRLADVLSGRVLAPGADGRLAAYAECWSVVYFLARKHPGVLAEVVAGEDAASIASRVLPLESEWESFLRPLLSADGER